MSKQHYDDILDAVKGNPFWFDENGVPRYGIFTPSAVANTGASEVILLLISCQHCGTFFRVAISQPTGNNPLRDQIRDVSLVGYGDPPNMGCCTIGFTMTSVPIVVLEYWHRNLERNGEWERNPHWEVKIVEELGE